MDPDLRRSGDSQSYVSYCSLGDEGLAALVAPPPTGAPLPPTGVLTTLQTLYLCWTQITEAGCAAAAAALDSGALPALKVFNVMGHKADAAAQATVHEVMEVEKPLKYDMINTI